MSEEGCEMFFECIYNAIYNPKISSPVKEQLKNCLLPVKSKVKYIADTSKQFKKRKNNLKFLEKSSSIIADSLIPILDSEIKRRGKKKK